LNNIPDIFSIARRTGRPLILDGAIGSLLQSKFKSDDSLWMSYLNISAPPEVLKLHKAYIDSGADIITTNTFRTNPAAFSSNKYTNSKKYCKAALDIAYKAVKNTPVIIAGSNPPAEDCYQKERFLSETELQKNHIRHINNLVNSGAHIILNETFSHMDEINIVCRYCSDKNIPFIMSLYFTEDMHLLSGEKVKDAVKYVLGYNPLAVSFNCIKPEHFERLLHQIKLSFNWGTYFNCGSGAVTDPVLSCGISSEEYGNFIKNLFQYKPSFIGACCGSSPLYIKQIKKAIDERNCN